MSHMHCAMDYYSLWGIAFTYACEMLHSFYIFSSSSSSDVDYSHKKNVGLAFKVNVLQSLIK